ncbi:radical SAM family heme chaperone HemW [Salipiger sp.]|uniref:radical SAM family heme chaperone HemW n=1 Tax=Salipiger sp. TaxID=2078585 RepID=UPI003A971694
MPEFWESGGFGLYVHWPFCEAKCPYCDFNSHVTGGVDHEAWARALVSELDRYGALTSGRVLQSIYFGGGTPSLMVPATVEKILSASRNHWAWSNDIEITIEANPRSVEAHKFEGFALAGVNRVSLGIQALNDADLKRLGRLHGVDEAIAALELARQIFPRVSNDLIYARQGQSLADWEAELRTELDLAGEHLSLYQLTIEQGTAFWTRHRAGKLRGLPDEDLAADMFLATQEICEAHGRPAYEVSNHAPPGAESKHNLIYWRGGDYVGIGPGAHGRVTLDGIRHATEAWALPSVWMDRANAGSADKLRDRLDAAEILSEYVMMGLRVTDGIDLARVERLYPAGLPEQTLVELEELDLLWRKDGRLGVTTAGRMVLNRIVTELLPD